MVSKFDDGICKIQNAKAIADILGLAVRAERLDELDKATVEILLLSIEALLAESYEDLMNSLPALRENDEVIRHG